MCSDLRSRETTTTSQLRYGMMSHHWVDIPISCMYQWEDHFHVCVLVPSEKSVILSRSLTSIPGLVFASITTTRLRGFFIMLWLSHFCSKYYANRELPYHLYNYCITLITILGVSLNLFIGDIIHEPQINCSQVSS